MFNKCVVPEIVHTGFFYLHPSALSKCAGSWQFCLLQLIIYRLLHSGLHYEPCSKLRRPGICCLLLLLCCLLLQNILTGLTPSPPRNFSSPSYFSSKSLAFKTLSPKEFPTDLHGRSMDTFWNHKIHVCCPLLPHQNNIYLITFILYLDLNFAKGWRRFFKV